MARKQRHTDQDIEMAIQRAEAAGWTVIKGTSHVWGILYCPHHDRSGCRVNVYSTPRNPSAAALRIARQVNNCPHQTPP